MHKKVTAGRRKAILVVLLVGALLLAASFAISIAQQQGPLEIAWKVEVQGDSPLMLFPRQRGGVIFSGYNQIIYLNSEGEIDSEFSPVDPCFWRSTLDDAGNLYVCDTSGYMYSLDPDGTQRWKLRLYGNTSSQSNSFSGFASVGKTRDEDILALTNSSELVLVSSSGVILKTVKLAFAVDSSISPLQLEDGSVVVATEKEYPTCGIKCVDWSGQVLWSGNLTGNGIWQICQLNDLVVANAISGEVICFSPSGQQLWNFADPDYPPEDIHNHFNTLYGNGRDCIFVVARNKLFQVSTDGSYKVLYESDFDNFGGFAIGSSDLIYLVSIYEPTFDEAYSKLNSIAPQVAGIVKKPKNKFALVKIQDSIITEFPASNEVLGLECGPGAEGEFYGSHRRFTPDRQLTFDTILFRVDP